MRKTAVLRQLLLWSLALSGLLAAQAMAQAPSAQEQLQVYACRATSSLLLYRGEGFQAAHRERLDNDLAALAGALQSLPQPSDELRREHQALVDELRQGVTFGPSEEDLPWSYPRDLAKALREFLASAGASGDAPPSVPVQVEYLAVQYLFRAYLGSFETAKEDSGHYLGQDERALVPTIDAELTGNPARYGKVKVRWDYLKVALSDMNSGISALQSKSGRPFAPTMVDRHSRALTRQLMN